MTTQPSAPQESCAPSIEEPSRCAPCNRCHHDGENSATAPQSETLTSLLADIANAIRLFRSENPTFDRNPAIATDTGRVFIVPSREKILARVMPLTHGKKRDQTSTDQRSVAILPAGVQSAFWTAPTLHPSKAPQGTIQADLASPAPLPSLTACGHLRSFGRPGLAAPITLKIQPAEGLRNRRTV